MSDKLKVNIIFYFSREVVTIGYIVCFNFGKLKLNICMCLKLIIKKIKHIGTLYNIQ